MRMIANIIIKVRKDILKFNVIFSVRIQGRGKNEKGGVGRREQKSVMKALWSSILDPTARGKRRLFSPVTIRLEAQTSEEGKEECVVVQYSEKISCFWKDWNFCYTSQPKWIIHLEVTWDSGPLFYYYCVQPVCLTCLKRTRHNQPHLTWNTHIISFYKLSKCIATILKLFTVPCPWPR